MLLVDVSNCVAAVQLCSNKEICRHFIHACMTIITDACVEQTSSSTAQDETTKEDVSGYQAYACYVL